MNRSHGRCSGLVRVLRVAKQVERLATRPNLEMLAAEHDVTTRTIRRDLAALQEAGWPVPTYRTEETL